MYISQIESNSLVNQSQRDGIHVTESECKRKSGVVFRSGGNLVVVREVSKTVPCYYAGSGRGAITGFSQSSGVRMRRYLRECAAEYTTMLTLTYPGFFPSNGTVVKEHLRRFLQELKREHGRVFFGNESEQKHSSFWFLEFQERGAPHYHIFTTWAPSKEWVAKRWYEIVGSEDERHLHAGTRTEYIRAGRKGTVSYASKYAAKLEQKVCPENYENVGRWWGVTGRRQVVSADTFVSRSEADVSDSKGAVNSFYRWLNMLILYSRATVLVREKGVLVMSVYDKSDQAMTRSKICQIAFAIRRENNMFIDAELDYGEDY